MLSGQASSTKQVQKTISPSKMLTSTEARDIIHKYLNMTEYELSKAINVLTLLDISQYIAAAELVKDELIRINKAYDDFKKRYEFERYSTSDNYTDPMFGRTYSFRLKYNSSWGGDFTAYPPVPSNEQVTLLLFKLKAQKTQLKGIKILKEMLQHNTEKTLDPEEKSEDRIVSYAENTAALEALNRYQNLLNHNRELYDHSQLLEKQLADKEILTKKLLSQDEKLPGHIVDSYFLTELHLSQAQTKALQLQNQQLKQEHETLIITKSRLENESKQAQSKLMEENARLQAEIKDQEQKHATEQLSIPREVFIQLLQNLNENKTRMKLFSPQTRNEAREKLQELSRKPQDYIYSTEIKACIEKDSILLQVFSDPTIHYKKETRTIKLVRALSQLCEKPQASLKLDA